MSKRLSPFTPRNEDSMKSDIGDKIESPRAPRNAEVLTADHREKLARAIAGNEVSVITASGDGWLTPLERSYIASLLTLPSAVAATDWRAAYWRLAKNLDLAELADYDDELAAEVRTLKDQAEPKPGESSPSPAVAASSTPSKIVALLQAMAAVNQVDKMEEDGKLREFVENMISAAQEAVALLSSPSSTERAILDRCHHALGESEHSDDESLPDCIAQHIRERDQRIAELETRIASSIAAPVVSTHGPHEPPLMYDPKRGRMVAPGADLKSQLRGLFDKTAETHDGDYKSKVDAAIMAIYVYGRREAPAHGADGMPNDGVSRSDVSAA